MQHWTDPLDCAKTSTAAEMAICKSYALGQGEARVANCSVP
jgi:uncharacterized protein